MSRSRAEQPSSADGIPQVVGAIFGLIVGYVLWLVAITLGDDVTTVGTWGLVVAVASGGLAVGAVIGGLVLRWRRRFDWSAFAFGVAVLPVVLSLALLANLYF